MDFFSHVLWTSVLTRNKLWQDEAILFAILPDMGFLLILMYVFFGTSMSVDYQEALNTIPGIYMVIYHSLHSFVVLGAVALAVWKFKPKLLPALSGWALHICMDIPFHGGIFATRLLYPILPNVYLKGFAGDDYRIILASYFLVAMTWLYLESRDLKKHRRRHYWTPDWLDRSERFVAAALINMNLLPRAHAEGADNGGAYQGVSGEDPHGLGEGEGDGADTLPPPEAG